MDRAGMSATKAVCMAIVAILLLSAGLGIGSCAVEKENTQLRAAD